MQRWESKFSKSDLTVKRWNCNATTLIMHLTSGGPGSSAGQYWIVYQLRSRRGGSNCEPIGQALGYVPGAFLKMRTRTKQTELQTLEPSKSARELCKIMETIVAQFAFSKEGLRSLLFEILCITHVLFVRTAFYLC
jgi:hypothetical protein